MKLLKYILLREMENPTPPDLRLLDEGRLREEAMKFWEQLEDEEIFMLMSSGAGLEFVWQNETRMRARGTYERCLLNAFTRCKTGWHHWPLRDLVSLFRIADRTKLLEASDPIPEQETFKLYRGVSGRGRARRVRALSWTANPYCAAWFAESPIPYGNPAVFTVTVRREEILARCGPSFRNEDEYLLLPQNLKPKRVIPIPDSSVYEEERKKRRSGK